MHERAIYMVNSFQFTRSARLSLVYPINADENMMLIGVYLRSSAAINVFFSASQGAVFRYVTVIPNTSAKRTGERLKSLRGVSLPLLPVLSVPGLAPTDTI
jgi:hypothetical protein